MCIWGGRGTNLSFLAPVVIALLALYQNIALKTQFRWIYSEKFGFVTLAVISVWINSGKLRVFMSKLSENSDFTVKKSTIKIMTISTSRLRMSLWFGLEKKCPPIIIYCLTHNNVILVFYWSKSFRFY